MRRIATNVIHSVVWSVCLSVMACSRRDHSVKWHNLWCGLFLTTGYIAVIHRDDICVTVLGRLAVRIKVDSGNGFIHQWCIFCISLYVVWRRVCSRCHCSLSVVKATVWRFPWGQLMKTTTTCWVRGNAGQRRERLTNQLSVCSTTYYYLPPF